MRCFLVCLCLCSQAYAVSYHELYCSRIDREQNQRNIIIRKIDKNLERILKILKHERSEDLINQQKLLRLYKNWDYKNQRLKRKSTNYIEFAVTRGCPLL